MPGGVPAVAKRRGPQPWVSLGSEQEVDAEQYVPSTQRVGVLDVWVHSLADKKLCR